VLVRLTLRVPVASTVGLAVRVWDSLDERLGLAVTDRETLNRALRDQERLGRVTVGLQVTVVLGVLLRIRDGLHDGEGDGVLECPDREGETVGVRVPVYVGVYVQVSEPLITSVTDSDAVHDRVPVPGGESVSECEADGVHVAEMVRSNDAERVELSDHDWVLLRVARSLAVQETERLKVIVRVGRRVGGDGVKVGVRDWVYVVLNVIRWVMDMDLVAVREEVRVELPVAVGDRGVSVRVWVGVGVPRVSVYVVQVGVKEGTLRVNDSEGLRLALLVVVWVTLAASDLVGRVPVRVSDGERVVVHDEEPGERLCDRLCDPDPDWLLVAEPLTGEGVRLVKLRVQVGEKLQVSVIVHGD